MTDEQLDLEQNVGSPRDVLDYLNWWDEMLWREAHRADPTVGWQRDMSWDEIAAIVGVEPSHGTVPGEVVMNTELAVALYWPGSPPMVTA